MQAPRVQASTHYDPASRRLLLYSIGLLNYPVSIALFRRLLQGWIKRKSAVSLPAIFAAMTPLAMLLSAHSLLANHSREIPALVIGIFMHISTTILFESSDIHCFNFAKLTATAVGTFLGFASLMLH